MLLSLSSTLLNIIYILILLWFIVLITAIISLSRRSDIAKPVKIFWAAIIFFAPVAGLLLYLSFSFKNKKRGIKRF